MSEFLVKVKVINAASLRNDAADELAQHYLSSEALGNREQYNSGKRPLNEAKPCHHAALSVQTDVHNTVQVKTTQSRQPAKEHNLHQAIRL